MSELTSVRNSKRTVTTTLMRSEFQKLTTVMGQSLGAVAGWNPSTNNPTELRNQLGPLYVFLAKHAQDLFMNEFNPELISNVSFPDLTLKAGVISVKFNYHEGLKDYTYRITFQNDLAPHADVWPAMLRKHGSPQIAVDRYLLLLDQI